MSVALVTGGTGFTGRHLLARLADEGVRRVAAARTQPPGALDADDFEPCDVTDAASVERVVAHVRPDLLFHLAGTAGGSPERIHEVNAGGTAHVLEAVRRHRPGCAVLVVGSAAEYGTVPEARLPITECEPAAPASPYGRAKLAGTEAALRAARDGVRAVVARPFNIVGAGVPETLVVGAVLRRALDALARGEEDIPVGNLESQRDFVAAPDVADAYVRMLRAEAWGRIFNVCSGRPRRIREVLETLLAHAPRPVRLRVDPELVRGAEVSVSYGSWESAAGAFGFEPRTPLERALADAWRHAEEGA